MFESADPRFLPNQLTAPHAYPNLYAAQSHNGQYGVPDQNLFMNPLIRTNPWGYYDGNYAASQQAAYGQNWMGFPNTHYNNSSPPGPVEDHTTYEPVGTPSPNQNSNGVASNSGTVCEQSPQHGFASILYPKTEPLHQGAVSPTVAGLPTFTNLAPHNIKREYNPMPTTSVPEYPWMNATARTQTALPGTHDGTQRTNKPPRAANSNGKTRTKDKYRVVYTEFQRSELEKEYFIGRYVTIKRKTELSGVLDLSERQIKIWFQNRRAKDRKVKAKPENSDQYDNTVMNDPTAMSRAQYEQQQAQQHAQQQASHLYMQQQQYLYGHRPVR